MLKPEDARKQLAALKDPKHRKAREEKIAGLPAEVKQAYFGSQDRNALGKSIGDYEASLKVRKEANAYFRKNPKQVSTILHRLFPTLADLIEAGHELDEHLRPISHRPFRAPHRKIGNFKSAIETLSEFIKKFQDFPDAILTPQWLAAWAIHVQESYEDYLGKLLAAAINRDEEGVFETVKECISAQHDIGGFHHSLAAAMFLCDKPEAWEFMGKTLLAAQRQEGLRQIILNNCYDQHPDAFRRMLRVIIDNDLARFSSVAQAVQEWLWDEESALAPGKLKKDIERVHTLLNDADERTKAIAQGDPHECYFGLWCAAFEDVDKAIPLAIPILKDKKPGRRLAAARILTQIDLPETEAPLFELIDDPELVLVRYGLNASPNPLVGDAVPPKAFERVVATLKRLPDKPTELKPIVEGWGEHAISKAEAASHLYNMVKNDESLDKMLPYISHINDYQQGYFIDEAVKKPTVSPAMRNYLLGAVGSRSTHLQEEAAKALKQVGIREDELPAIEGYLTRKSKVREAIFQLIVGLSDEIAMTSMARLLAAKDPLQRLGGIEIGRQLIEAKRSVEAVKGQLGEFRDAKKRPKAEVDALAFVDAIETVDANAPTLENFLGLIDPAEFKMPTAPQKKKVVLHSKASVEFIKSLDAWIHEHRDRTFKPNDRCDEEVLGSVNSWSFPTPCEYEFFPKDMERLPLLELWQEWWTNRPAKTRDKDGFELLRTSSIGLLSVREGEEELDSKAIDEPETDSEEVEVSAEKKAVERARKRLAVAIRESQSLINPNSPIRVRYAGLIERMLLWFNAMYPPAGASAFLFDATEATFALVPASLLEEKPILTVDRYGRSCFVGDWREPGLFKSWRNQLDIHRRRFPKESTPLQTARYYRLMCWFDRCAVGFSRRRIDVAPLLEAFETGCVPPADIYDHLIGPRGSGTYSEEAFELLSHLTAPDAKTASLLKRQPILRQALDATVDKILAIELARGEKPTVASSAALKIQRLSGIPTLFRLIANLGKSGFGKVESYSYRDDLSKPAILTKLITRTVPTATDTPELFAAQAKEQATTSERLIELALLNPLWVKHVEATIKWPGLCEAVWWFMAHTQNQWARQAPPTRVVGEKEEVEADDGDADGDEDAGEEADASVETYPGWNEILKSRSNLSQEQRSESVVDVSWFHKAYKAVGNKKRWEAIEEASKYLTGGQANKKAVRLADVLLGVMKKKEIVTGIKVRNLKEYVALLGLLPLPTDPAKRDAELQDRYKVLKAYERYAKGLSSLSKEPALQAARLGQQNLASTAGFSDPMRLEWAVSASVVKDLLSGPVVVSVKDVSVRLALDPLGVPEIIQDRAGKPLKTVPPDVKKNPKVAELFERRKDLQRLSAGTRNSLEQAMCQATPFTATEVKQLMAHAIVKPLFEKLVLKGEGILGYPDKDGKVLRNYDDKLEPIKASEKLVVAHPLDLLADGNWTAWQSECFRHERLQPFKQIFREVYVPTKAEKSADSTMRYAGQQVNPRQALALFASRGWSTQDGVDKLYRGAGLMAQAYFGQGWTTPAEMEAPTLERLVFLDRTTWKPVKLKDVPATIFSETMRDLDLVVSVGHVGGVDPEASASTVEMRTALLKETATLLGIKNLKYDKQHILIAGKYGKYSVHLGSAVVHKQPGGSLCIVPVHSQHRGRLFLPFADSDPRTAEVISKVLLLARDHEIQDPIILEQIAGR